MKTINKLITMALMLAGMGAGVQAQTSATATATGTLVSAITIAAADGAVLNFGRVVAGTAGTVVVPGVSAPTRTSSLGLAGGTVNSAGFTINGVDGSPFTVTLPSTPVRVMHTNSTDYMEVTNFSCDVVNPGTSVVGATASSVLSGTSRTFYVGATLNVKTGDPVGVYTSATFPVTVSYQ